MGAPFVFRKVLYLVEAVGLRAATLDQLLRALNVVDGWSIAYHMHSQFLTHKFAHGVYPNDFARWVGTALGDDVLAEKLSSLRVFRHSSLDTLRVELGRLIAQHLIEFPERAAERSTRGLDFHFSKARPAVMECPQRARDLAEFQTALAEIPASSLYFHLFETRFERGGDQDNDFAEWMDKSLALPELAREVASLDPYMFSIDEVRLRLIGIVGRHLTQVQRS